MQRGRRTRIQVPDRLLSLVVLVGCWIPPAVMGWAVARWAHQRSLPIARAYIVVFAVVGLWAAAWFLVNLFAMPPYIPGATADPSDLSLKSMAWLALVTTVIVLPSSAIAGVVAFRAYGRARARM